MVPESHGSAVIVLSKGQSSKFSIRRLTELRHESRAQYCHYRSPGTSDQATRLCSPPWVPYSVPRAFRSRPFKTARLTLVKAPSPYSASSMFSESDGSTRSRLRIWCCRHAEFKLRQPAPTSTPQGPLTTPSRRGRSPTLGGAVCNRADDE